MFELGDPVHFEDEQANAGQSQEQEHTNSLMVEMVRMFIGMMMRRRSRTSVWKTHHNAHSCLLSFHPFGDLAVHNPHPPDNADDEIDKDKDGGHYYYFCKSTDHLAATLATMW